MNRYVADFREFLKEGTFPEHKALIRNFVEGIEVVGEEAVLTYTIPMPNDGVTSESVWFLISSSPERTATVAESWVDRAASHIRASNSDSRVSSTVMGQPRYEVGKLEHDAEGLWKEVNGASGSTPPHYLGSNEGA